MAIDAFIAQGHGRSTDGTWDSGCTYGNYTEEKLMRPIVRSFVDTLRSHGLTVDSDIDTGNDRNCTYTIRDANVAGASIYISNHCDYELAPSGTYPIVYPGSSEGIRLAQCLDNAVRARIAIGTRGILQRDDMEVANTNMPACIFETGSIKADLAILRDQASAYGQAEAYGVLDYFGISYDATAPSAPSVSTVDTPVATTGTEKDICLEYGDESIVVGQLQKDLRAMAYEDENGNAIAVDDDFGPATLYAVKRLQSCHGLEVDGIYGPLSDAALMSEIREVQQALVNAGYSIEVDGAVGTQTDNTIRDFQFRHGLEVDGIVGTATRKALGI